VLPSGGRCPPHIHRNVPFNFMRIGESRGDRRGCSPSLLAKPSQAKPSGWRNERSDDVVSSALSATRRHADGSVAAARYYIQPLSLRHAWSGWWDPPARRKNAHEFPSSRFIIPRNNPPPQHLGGKGGCQSVDAAGFGRLGGRYPRPVPHAGHKGHVLVHSLYCPHEPPRAWSILGWLGPMVTVLANAFHANGTSRNLLFFLCNMPSMAGVSRNLPYEK
jgi:hypothetical protein